MHFRLEDNFHTTNLSIAETSCSCSSSKPNISSKVQLLWTNRASNIFLNIDDHRLDPKTIYISGGQSSSTKRGIQPWNWSLGMVFALGTTLSDTVGHLNVAINMARNWKVTVYLHSKRHSGSGSVTMVVNAASQNVFTGITAPTKQMDMVVYADKQCHQ